MPDSPGLEEILADVPPVRHAFAYGSGVFEQPGLYDEKGPKPMVDYFLVVEDAVSWHNQNIQLNPNHYGSISALGGSVLQYVARNVGVNVHFNTLVAWRDKVVKYGVIETRDAIRDLCNWDKLYVAGRLHKPVLTLASDTAVEGAQRVNRRLAVITALVLLPEVFDRPQLHRTLCGISYRGDVRMTLAEDSRKVARIADGSNEHLAKIYGDQILQDDFKHVELNVDAAGVWRRDTSKNTTISLLSKLPSTVLLRALDKLGVTQPHRNLLPIHETSHQQLDSCTHDLVQQQDPSYMPALTLTARHSIAQQLYDPKGRHVALVAGALGSIVARSSRWQACAGLIANGPRKSLVYVGRKVIKSLSGWMKQ